METRHTPKNRDLPDPYDFGAILRYIDRLGCPFCGERTSQCIRALELRDRNGPAIPCGA